MNHKFNIDDTQKVCPNQNINLENWTCTSIDVNTDQQIVDASTLTFKKIKNYP